MGVPHVDPWQSEGWPGHILTVSTVNDPGGMERYLAMEDVDGIVTDRPELLAARPAGVDSSRAPEGWARSEEAP